MAGHKKRADWLAIRADYVAGVPLPAICERHGIPLATLKPRASREGWKVERAAIAERVREEIPLRIAEAAIESAAAAVSRHGRIWGLALDRVEALLSAPDAPRQPAQIRDLCQAIKLATEGQRLSLGLRPDERPQEPTHGADDPGAGDLDAAGLEQRYREAIKGA